MRDKELMRSILLNKFSDRIISSIVAESFYRGLPLNRNAVKENIQELVNYSNAIMESLGPSDMLRKALEDNPEDKYLHSFASDVMSIANSAAVRCANEAAVSVRSLDEIVDDSDFTDEELRRLKAKGIKLDTKAIGEIINKKVLDVIKSEKEEYEEAEALKEKLSDAISSLNEEDKEADPALDDDSTNSDDIDITNDVADGTDTASNAIDSYINTHLGAHMVKSHVSLFSAMQIRAMESIINTNELYLGELPLNTLKLLANEAFDGDIEASVFAKLMTSMKSLATMKNNDIKINDVDEDLIENATVCAIVFYTFLETLNTLKLHKPTKEELVAYINSKSNSDVDFKHRADEFANDLNSYLTEIENEFTKYSNERLEEVIDELDEIEDEAEELNNDIDKVYPAVFDKLEKLEDKIKEELDRRRSAKSDTEEGEDDVNLIKEDMPPESSYFDALARESNIAEFNKVARYAKRENVSSIMIHVDEVKNPVVELKSYEGQSLHTYELNIKDSKMYVNKIETVLESALNSDIIYSNKIMQVNINGKVRDLIQ